MFLLRDIVELNSINFNLQMQYNTWNPGCMHYVLLCRANIGQAFRLSRTSFVKKACMNLNILVNRSIKKCCMFWFHWVRQPCSEKNDTKIIKFGQVVLILWPFLETYSSNFRILFKFFMI